MIRRFEDKAGVVIDYAWCEPTADGLKLTVSEGMERRVCVRPHCRMRSNLKFSEVNKKMKNRILQLGLCALIVSGCAAQPTPEPLVTPALRRQRRWKNRFLKAA